MILVSLVLVFAVERMVNKPALWQVQRYSGRYLQLVRQQGWITVTSASWRMFVLIALPALVIGWLDHVIEQVLLELCLYCAVLLSAVSCPQLRRAFKDYLQAANRGEQQLCDQHADELGFQPAAGYTLGQHLVWINFQHYMAVALWFAAFGVTGVILYAGCRCVGQELVQQQHPQRVVVAKLLFVLEWLPARLASFGFLLVGQFNRGFAVWLKYLGNFQATSMEVIASVARATEVVESERDDRTEEPCAMLQLARRNLMLLLVALAMLTLSGWIG